MATTTTTNYSLRKHDDGDLNWGSDLNYNFDLLDSLFDTHEGQQLNPADTDTDKNKHLSNAQAKKWEDHVDDTTGNPHEVTAEQAGALPFLVGTTLERPEEPEVGQMYFDTDLGCAIWWDGVAWVTKWEDHVSDSDNPHSVTPDQIGALSFLIGTTLERPSSPEDGQMYFDTDLGIPIWWTGSIWINASGNDVDI